MKLYFFNIFTSTRCKYKKRSYTFFLLISESISVFRVCGLNSIEFINRIPVNGLHSSV